MIIIFLRGGFSDKKNRRRNWLCFSSPLLLAPDADVLGAAGAWNLAPGLARDFKFAGDVT